MRKNADDAAGCGLTSGTGKHFLETRPILDKSVHNVQYVQNRYPGLWEGTMQHGAAMRERKERIFAEGSI